jgi:hypothetical protein
VARRACLAALLVAALLPGAARAEGLRAGFGTAPLPLPEGGPLAGYGGLRERTASGVLDPPEARALLLEAGATRVALVALDVLIARPRLREALVARTAGLDLDLLLLAATHTHSGPGGYEPGWVAARVTGASFDPAATERLADAAARAVEAAARGLGAGRVAAGLFEAPLAENRRDEDGRDESALPVLRVELDDGGPPAVLFAFGAHPIVLSNRSRDYSADYVGAARARLAAAGWRPLFVAGPLGDQRPVSALGELWPRELERQREQARDVGERLAGAVMAGLARLGPGRSTRLEVAERWVELPAWRMRRWCPTWWLAPLLRGSVRGFLSERAPFVALRVGPATLLALPAEPASALGERLRQRSGGGSVPFVIAHANDWLGYAVSPDAYRRGGYEACLSFFGPDFGPWLVEQAEATLAGLDDAP